MKVTAILSFPIPTDARVKVKTGDLVDKNEIVAVSPEVKTPFKGKIGQIRENSFDLSFPAVEIKGKWSSGQETHGELLCFGTLSADVHEIQTPAQKKILVVLGTIKQAFLYKAITLGICGLIVGNLDEHLKKDIEKEHLLTVSFEQEKIPEEDWQILKHNENREALLSGSEAKILLPE